MWYECDMSIEKNVGYGGKVWLCGEKYLFLFLNFITRKSTICPGLKLIFLLYLFYFYL